MSFTKPKNSVVRKIRTAAGILGPGFITGAADDDDSGIGTYSIAGAQFGYRLSWLTLFCLPMMIAVQETCARIGIVTGRGLAGVIRDHYPRQVLFLVVLLLLVANIVNIGADLGAMSAVITMVVGLQWWIWLIAVTALTVILEIVVPYRKYEGFLRIFGFFLLAYVLTAVIVSPNAKQVVESTLFPHLELTLPFLAAAVGFLGTTISPYLFFWQASEEIEDEITQGEIRGFGMGGPKYLGPTIKKMRIDTIIGMIFSQVITLAIIITTAQTLNRAGITNIGTAQEAALALKPLAGQYAYLLFAVGIVGIGFQAVPVLAGSLAYAVAEVFKRPEGLGKPFRKARFFYLVIITSSVLGALMNVIGLNPIQALFYSAIVNGIIAVPLILSIILISLNREIMKGETSGPLSVLATGFTALVMGLASLGMIYTALTPP